MLFDLVEKILSAILNHMPSYIPRLIFDKRPIERKVMKLYKRSRILDFYFELKIGKLEI